MSFIEWWKSLFTTTEDTQKSFEDPKPTPVDLPSFNPKDAVVPLKKEEIRVLPVKPAEVKKPVSEKPMPVDPVTAKPCKIAVIVGHTPKDPGAVNYKNEGEFVFNSRIAKKIESIMKKKYPKKQVKIFLRNDGDFSKTVSQVAKQVGEFKAKVSLELHFNAVKQIAYGCEMLIWEGADKFEDTLKIADDITDRLALEFGLKERQSYKYKNGKYSDGVKVIARGDRGSWNIRACNQQGVVHALLIEPCFANNETAESRSIFENEDKYAEFLADELAKIDV